jgi:small-conductance mechanosensitive channel
VTTALQRSDLSELLSHWALEPSQALDIVSAVALIVIGAWVLRKLVRWLLTILGRRKFLPTQLIEAARRAASTLIILVAILLVLKSLGVSAKVLWSSVTGFLAVAAIAFFAAWSVLSNTFCALLLLTTRPFRVGDYIEVLESGEKPDSPAR